LGVSDARNLCSHSGVPSSKIYTILNKFELLGVVDIQRTQPARFRVLEPSIGINKLMKNKEKEIVSIKQNLPSLNSHLDSLFSGAKKNDGQDKTFFSLELGMKNHIQKHLLGLAKATRDTYSYFESTCLRGARIYGHLVKKEIVRNIMLNDIKSKIIFGVNDKKIIEAFMKGLPESDNIEAKVTKQIHAPFHVIDDENSILVIDNPLFKDERIASLQVTNRILSRQLREGYNALWDDAKQI